MSAHDTDLAERLNTLAAAFDMPAAPVVDDLRRGRRRARRDRTVVLVAAAAVVAVVLGAAAALGGPGRTRSDGVGPVEQPGLVVGDVPVWYDANGLHRGTVVEQTPVNLIKPEKEIAPDQFQPMEGALALVRTGAVYLDPATHDVWFHPWGGRPRIVGHDSKVGPGGDPNGDTAAWFEGFDADNGAPGGLVVYDTARGRVISRTPETYSVSAPMGDHYPAGSGFLQVTSRRVVWAAANGGGLFVHDVPTRTTTEVPRPTSDGAVLDVHGPLRVQVDGQNAVLHVPDRPDQRYEQLEPRGWLSPTGGYFLSVEGTKTRHAAAIVDTITGELWQVPWNKYPWIAWSYGNTALIDVEDALVTCDAEARTCETLPAERPFLMPTT